MPDGADARRHRADVPLLCDLNLHQTALTDGNSVPGSALDRRGDASASFPSGFAPVLGSLGLTGFHHIDAVVSDLVRRGTRLHSLTLHRCPGTLHSRVDYL